MTTFDPADAKVSLFRHLVNIDFWTADIDDDDKAAVEKAKLAAEDFAGMVIESLSVNPVGISESGALMCEIKPLKDQDLEDWIIRYAEGYEVSETLDG